MGKFKYPNHFGFRSDDSVRVRSIRTPSEISDFPEGQAYGAGRFQLKTVIWHLASGICLLTALCSLPSALCFAVSVTHIFPQSGTNDGPKNVVVFGSGFSGTPVVQLRDYSGTTVVIGDNVTVDPLSEGHKLTCSFGLTDCAVGTYSLEVEGGERTLPSAFTVHKKIPAPVTCLFQDYYKYFVGSGGAKMRDLAVGDGNNDGKSEVYAACQAKRVYQFKWISARWEEIPDGGIYIGEEVECVVVGDGDNDGYNEVYAGGYDTGKVYQCKYSTTTSQWEEPKEMGQTGWSIWDLAIGDGDNDGKLEVYAANGDHNIYQYKWNGTSWSKSLIGSGGEGMGGVAVGDGDNDGKLEVYGANYDDYVYEYTWTGSSWDVKKVEPIDGWRKWLKDNLDWDVGSGTWNCQRVRVGDGDNDGNFEVYAANSDKTVYGFRWQDGEYQPFLLGQGTDQMWDVAVGDGNNDGKLEVYAACFDEHVYQFRWVGSPLNQWKKKDLGAPGSGENYGIGVGDGNNDGKLEIYAANQDDKCYQYKIDDYYAPAAIETLTASPGDYEGQIKLTWRAVDEDDYKYYYLGITSSATYYIVKYHDHPIGSNTIFNQAWTIDQDWEPKGSGQWETYTIGGFTGGATYYFSIKAVDNSWPTARISPLGNCATSWAQVDVAPPAKIEDLSALTGPAEAEISLIWTAVGDDATTGTADHYLVRYSSLAEINSDATWEEANEYDVTGREPLDPGNLEKLTMANLKPGTTYWIAIKAVDDLGQAGVVSNSAWAWAKVDIIPPADVDNLSAQPGDAEGKIELSWTAPGDDGTSGQMAEGSWQIKYGTQAEACGYQTEIPFTEVSAGSPQSHTVSGLTPTVTYYFQLKTCDNAGNWSGLSNQTSSWAQKEWIPPAQITDLTAAEGKGEGEIDLTWTAPGDDGTSGDITNGSWQIFYSTDYRLPITDYQITISTSCSPGSPQSCTISVPLGNWYVTIAAVDEVGNQGPASDPAGPVQVRGIPPDPIKDLSASEGTKEGEVDLTWTAPGNDGNEGSIVNGLWRIGYSTDYQLPITDYQIEIPTSSSPGDNCSCTVSGLTGVTHYFVIATVDDAGNQSEWSNVAESSVKAVPPAKITDLDAKPGAEEGEIKLTWTAVGDDGMEGRATSYVLKYSIRSKILTDAEWNSATPYAQDWTPAESGQPDTGTLQGLPGKKHWFALKAIDDAGNAGKISNPASATPPHFPPAKITDLVASPAEEESQIVLTWTAVGDDGTEGKATAYEVRYATVEITDANWDRAFTYQQSWQPKPSGTKEENRKLVGLAGNTTYYIAVKAIDHANNYGPLSNVDSASVPAFPPAAITDLTAKTAEKEGQITLNWTAPGDDGYSGILPSGSKFRIDYSTQAKAWTPTNYNIEISTSNVQPGTGIGYLVADLIGGTTYYFRIWTCDEGSNWSKISNGATAWARLGPPPSLEWAGEPDYIDKGVNPQIGTSETEYVYRVKYRDEENSPPRKGYPYLYIAKNGVEIAGRPFEMRPLRPGSTDYKQGEIYTLRISGSQLGDIGASYTYWFAAKNQRNELFATGPPTKVSYGPSILEWSAPGDLPEKLTVAGNNLINLNDSDPEKNRCRIIYWVAAEGEVSIEIFNLSGKKIKDIDVSSTQAGAYEECWDGTDADNQPVGTGVYFMRIKTKTYEKMKKIFVLR